MKESSSQGDNYPFDASYLDFSHMLKDSYNTSTLQDGTQVHLNMQEHVYKNKVKFVNLPAEAQMVCEGGDLNTALQTLDLAGEKSISLKYNFWVATDEAWLGLESLKFSCWYEVAGRRSAKIHFDVSLKEAEVLRASIPTYTGVEGYGSAVNGEISADGRYVAFATVVAYDETDLNGEMDIYVRDLQTQELRRVSVSSSGLEADGKSERPKISEDGRYIVFLSNATNLVEGDTNGVSDVFFHDVTTSTTKRVSVHSDGSQGNNSSLAVNISADGRFVVFDTYASNLVAGDTNNADDIFVHELETSVTTRVSVASDGTQNNGNIFDPTISADGRYVAFSTFGSTLVAGDTNFANDIFVHDRETATTERVSVSSLGAQANGASSAPSISSDGRYVVFSSGASNLVAGDTNGVTDIFLRDRQTGSTTRVSVGEDGAEANGHSYNPVISLDGKVVAYDSRATNLVAGDLNNSSDVFTFNRESGEVRLVSRNNAGEIGNGYSGDPSISGDGQYIVMGVYLSNFIEGQSQVVDGVFVRDVQMQKTSMVSFQALGTESDSYSLNPSLSGDGRYVCYESQATNLAPGHENWAIDIYAYDRMTGTNIPVSVDNSGVESESDTYKCSISGDGRYVVYSTWASNLVAGDVNSREDIFIYDLTTRLTSRVSVSSLGVEGDGHSYDPAISENGRYVVFESGASNLVAGDTNGVYDIFVHDRQTGETKRISVSSTGVQANGYSEGASISADGRYITYISTATNLVGDDTNGVADAFVYDQQTAITKRVSVSSGGVQGNLESRNPVISGNGRYVAFESLATNLVVGADVNNKEDVFVHDLWTGLTTLVSRVDGGWADNYSVKPSIDYSGQYIAFQSRASNLTEVLATDSADDIFVFDQTSGEMTMISVNSRGQAGNAGCYSPSISSDGRYVAASCYASNLVLNDSNDWDDIFIFKWR